MNITVRIAHPRTPTSPRNYSLSDRPGLGHYRISVKREGRPIPDAPDGLISTYLHEDIHPGDQLEIGPPCGEFTLDSSRPRHRPIVMIAGGIGITPLLSMAKELVHQRCEAPLYFLQAARNSSVHAFAEEVRQLANDGVNVQTRVLYNQPLHGDVAEQKCDAAGTVDAALLRQWTPYAEADFYFCGPQPFMQCLHGILDELGVEESRIHYEFFGPKQELSCPMAAV